MHELFTYKNSNNIRRSQAKLNYIYKYEYNKKYSYLKKKTFNKKLNLFLFKFLRISIK